MTSVPLLLFSLSFAYVSHHICLFPLQLHLITPSSPISLNSLDLAGVRLLSPVWLTDSTKTVAGADDASAGDDTELKWEFDEERRMCLFPMISSGAQLGRSGI